MKALKPKIERGILRIIDANFNRGKEGLRVVEDIFRYISCDDKLRKKTRKLRHALDLLTKKNFFKKAILSRNSREDLGRRVDHLELKRKNSRDTLYINLQRAKESIRVLEEFFKIIAPDKVSYIKKIRYELYSLEKAIVEGVSSLRYIR